MKRLYDRLQEYSASDYYGFHMPGHKRRPVEGADLPYGIDITEIEGFDDLHHPEGILRDAQQMAARVYGAEETRFLINGSTAGLLSGILGSTDRGGRILIARNCHKSVYHAVCLNELRPVYLYPEFDEELYLNTNLSVSAVKAALTEHSDIQAAVVVSPTYDGVISDVEEIADAVHAYGIPLIVDEAHGAHLGFHPYFEQNALAKGADIVIHSLHKTMPSLTQTALLHIQGKIANRRRILRYLDMLQTSSPSYVLMAGMDLCIHLLDEKREQLFEPYVKRLDRLRGRLRKLKHLELLETDRYDWSKIVIAPRDQAMNGRELYRILLERYHLQMEMAAGTYTVAMTSVGDSQEGFDRLEQALREIDGELEGKRRNAAGRRMPGRLPVNRPVMTSAEALRIRDGGSGVERVVWEDAGGRISGEYAYLYPPGSPLIVPGERISAQTVGVLEQYRRAGFSVEGPARPGYLEVLKE